MLEVPVFGMLPAGEAGEAEMDIEEEGPIREELGQTGGRVGDEERLDRLGLEFNENLVGKSSLVQVNVESNGDTKNCDASSSGEAVENGFFTSEYNDASTKHTRGVKRARVINDERQPSVHVSYCSLTRASKQKLEELMQQWSAWHAQHVSSLQGSAEVLESGEQIFFPALHVGEKKQSAVTFWMDHQPGKVQGNGLIVLENDVPLYDRGYGLGLTSVDGSSNAEGGLKIIGDAARCFNCGGYSHSLKDCPKPRDNVAVSNARNLHKSKRNQNSASCSSTRYYESASAGKFDGLKPGSLDDETRKILGLGELDPPPWLTRMRELGYPPGYLVPEDDEDEDEESGITIFADGESKQNQEEDREIFEVNPKPVRMKKSVEFPGVNGPVPEDADERKWVTVGPSNSNPTRHGSHHRPNHHHPMEPVSRTYSISYNNEHYRVSGYSREDNPPPPGTESVFHSPRERFSFGYGGSEFLRPLEDPLHQSLHDSLPHSYPGSGSRFLGYHSRRNDTVWDLDHPLQNRGEIHRNYSQFTQRGPTHFG